MSRWHTCYIHLISMRWKHIFGHAVCLKKRGRNHDEDVVFVRRDTHTHTAVEQRLCRPSPNAVIKCKAGHGARVSRWSHNEVMIYEGLKKKTTETLAFFCDAFIYIVSKYSFSENTDGNAATSCRNTIIVTQLRIGIRSANFAPHGGRKEERQKELKKDTTMTKLLHFLSWNVAVRLALHDDSITVMKTTKLFASWKLIYHIYDAVVRSRKRLCNTPWDSCMMMHRA